ncbi:MAG: DUF1499 domain-containing protein [Alphaproteobacteria bacterium]|nr:DUF1499 domain-containing protein [Alphaproteobacteria bacterium]
MSTSRQSLRAAKKGSGLTKISVALLVLCLLALAAVVIGLRMGEFSVRETFGYIEWIVYASAGVALIAIVAAFLAIRNNRPAAIAVSVLTLIAALLLVWVPYSNRVALRASPRLSDVTTDMRNPPLFEKTKLLRSASKARNTTDYSAAKAKLQRKHYPDIKPVILRVPTSEAFERALAAVKRFGWTVVTADKLIGRIEAFETSLVFGFVDDVSIRILSEGTGSRVDIRSSSRVGRRDAAMNANRVRKLIRAISQPQLQ